ncbi:MAG: hypothetical protein OXC07_09855 [Kistimonas sp.]|nr:hypothetical protein [Kistimonas sp.]
MYKPLTPAFLTTLPSCDNTSVRQAGCPATLGGIDKRQPFMAFVHSYKPEPSCTLAHPRSMPGPLSLLPLCDREVSGARTLPENPGRYTSASRELAALPDRPCH